MLIGGGVGVLVVVGLLLFLLTRGKKKAGVEVRAALPAGDDAKAAVAKEISAAQPDRAQLSGQGHEALAAPDANLRVETLRQNVRETVGRDPALAAGVIRALMAEESS